MRSMLFYMRYEAAVDDDLIARLYGLREGNELRLLNADAQEPELGGRSVDNPHRVDNRLLDTDQNLQFVHPDSSTRSHAENQGALAPCAPVRRKLSNSGFLSLPSFDHARRRM